MQKLLAITVIVCSTMAISSCKVTTDSVQGNLDTPSTSAKQPVVPQPTTDLSSFTITSPQTSDSLNNETAFDFGISFHAKYTNVSSVQFEATNSQTSVLLGTVYQAPYLIRTLIPDAGNTTLRALVTYMDGSTELQEIIVYIQSMSTPLPNNAPTANNDTFSIAQDTNLSINTSMLLSNDTDADGDSLVVTQVSGATNGSVTKNANTVTFTPNNGFYGNASFQYQISDGVDTDTAQVFINVAQVMQNQAPQANPDSFTINQDTALNINVSTLISNDMDPNGDNISISLVNAAQNGNVVKNGNTITFTPNNGFYGNASFRYTLSDGSLTDSTTVSITVNQVQQNQAPNANPDSDSTNQDSTLTINVSQLLSNDNDPDGDSISLTQVLNPSNGTVSISGNTVVFVPSNGFYGNASFQYKISDGSLTDTTTVSITVNQVQQNGEMIEIGNGGNIIGIDIPVHNYGPKDNLDCPNQNSSNRIFVDSNASGTGQGTYNNPYSSLSSLTSSRVTPGKTVCIKRGSTFNSRWNVPFSGNSSSPIIVTAYGNADLPEPLFTRANYISGWTQHSGNIYKAGGINLDPHKLFYNGELQTQGRFPNSGYIWREVHPQGQIKINDLSTHLSAFPGLNLVGAEIVTRITNWSFGIMDVTNVNGNIINYSVPSEKYIEGFGPIGDTWTHRWGTYFTNKLEFVDTPGEWYHDASQNILYFYSPNGTPPNNSVVALERDQTNGNHSSIDLNGRSYISFRNLDFQYNRFSAVHINGYNGGSDIEFSNCHFKNVQRAFRTYKDRNLKLNGNLFEDIYYEGFLTIDSLGGGEFENNLFRRIGVQSPQKSVEYSSWYSFGVTLKSSSNADPYLFKGNVLADTGYIGISAYGNGIIEENIVTRNNSTFNDGGGIAYDYVKTNQSLIVRRNIIVDSQGNLDGVDPNYYNYEKKAKGLYIGDQDISNVDMNSNIIADVRGAGIWMDHTMVRNTSGNLIPSSGHRARNNILFDTDAGIGHSDYSNYKRSDLEGLGWPCGNRSNAGNCFNDQYNDRIEGNIIYRTKSSQKFRDFLHVYSDGTANYNFDYPNLNPETGYLNRSNFFGSVNGVQGYSNDNIYVNPFSSSSWARFHCAFGPTDGIASCDNHTITLEDWKQGYHGQDQDSVEYGGLSGSSVPAQYRGILYINNTSSSKTFQTDDCTFKLNVNSNNDPSMQDTNGSLTVPAFSAVITEKDC